MADKSRFGPEKTEVAIDALVDKYYPREHHGVFNKTIIVLGLAGYKMIITIVNVITNETHYLSLPITSYPAHPRRIIVKDPLWRMTLSDEACSLRSSSTLDTPSRTADTHTSFHLNLEYDDSDVDGSGQLES